MYIRFLLFIAIYLHVNTINANSLEQEFIGMAAMSEIEFLEQFPYEQLLEDTDKGRIKYYEDLEQLLEKYTRPAGAFFLQLAEKQLEAIPLDLQNIDQLQGRVAFGDFLVRREERAFQIASDVVLENLAEQLEMAFQQEQLDKSDAKLLRLVEQLKEREYGVSIPVSNYEKGVHHLREGNLRYIWSRLWFDHPRLCVLGIISLVGLMYFIIKKIKKK